MMALEEKFDLTLDEEGKLPHLLPLFCMLCLCKLRRSNMLMVLDLQVLRKSLQYKKQQT